MPLSMRRVVALEGAAAIVTTGFALDAWPLLVTGVAGAVATLLRWRGRWATTHLAAALRRTPHARAGHLGLAERLVPGLSVVEHRDRNGVPVGIVGDGPGLATVVAVRAGAVDVADLVEWLAGDRAEPAGVQVLTELRFPPTPPAQSHRRFPVRPAAARTWLVLRHEPLWTPDEVDARGGGVAGARSAAVSATLRLTDRVPAVPLDAAAVRTLLRELGETGDAKALRGAWVARGVVHCTLSATATTQPQRDALTAALHHAGAPRVITSVVANRRTTITTVRLIGPADRVWHARTTLLKTGLTRSMFDSQSEGMVATLPLGRPTRRRADVLGLTRR